MKFLKKVLLTTLLLAVIPSTHSLGFINANGEFKVSVVEFPEYLSITAMMYTTTGGGCELDVVVLPDLRAQIADIEADRCHPQSSGLKATRNLVVPSGQDYQLWLLTISRGTVLDEVYLYYFGTTTVRANCGGSYNIERKTLTVTSDLSAIGALPLLRPGPDSLVQAATLIDKVRPIVKIEETGQILILNGTSLRDTSSNTVVTTYIVNENLVGKNLQIQFETEGENFILKSPVVTVQVQADTSAEELTVPDTSKVPYGPFDCTCRPQRIDPLCIAPAVVKGYVLPERCNPDVVNLLAIPLYPSCEFSFVARLFGAVGGKTDLLAETHTPWSQQNGVAIRKPLAESRVLGRTWIQYVVYTRNVGSKGQVVEYQFN
jgi:hypothetical protein